MASEFDIDPRNKLGADIDWLEDEDAFVAALNRGDSSITVPASVGSSSESGEPRKITETDLAELRAIFASYR